MPERCACEHRSVASRTYKNGAVCFGLWCLCCGSWRPIKKDDVAKHVGTGVIVAYDEHVSRDYWRRWGQDCESERLAKRDAENKQWLEKYNAYLNTPEWRNIRALALSRDGYLCQGCLQSPAEVVHHLSYQHVGRELLFELTSLCQACHDRAHEDPDRL